MRHLLRAARSGGSVPSRAPQAVGPSRAPVPRSATAGTPTPPVVRIRLCGPITSESTLAEIVNMLAVSGWEGELRVRSPTMRCRLLISRGALGGASSTVPEHRLGELLVQRGLISREQLERSLRETGRGRRIGQIVLDEGWIEHGQLFDALRAQVERIFFDALSLTAGSFAFVDVRADGAPAPIAFHMPLEGLILEAARRMDEMRVFRSRIESREACPALTGATVDAPLDPASAAIVAHIDGCRTIQEIVERTGLDEFSVTRAVYALMEHGLAEIRPNRTVLDRELIECIDAFDGVLRAIFVQATRARSFAVVHERVVNWIDASGLSDYLGVALGVNGALNRHALLLAVTRLDPQWSRAKLYGVLYDLTTFALFAAGPTLDAAEEEALARRVHQALRAVATPGGGTRLRETVSAAIAPALLATARRTANATPHGSPR